MWGAAPKTSAPIGAGVPLSPNGPHGQMGVWLKSGGAGNNLLNEYRLGDLFSNVCVSLRILLTIPATVASGERLFRKRKLIKDYLMSQEGFVDTISQEPLVDMTSLSTESNITVTLNFYDVIQNL